jgi:DNA-binding HxlR family transcriptional regulator
MKDNEKKISRRAAPRQVGRMVETVIGCKWSLTVLDLVGRDVLRPGEMERSIEGLTAKVLNDCLRRLVQFRVLEKRSYSEIPPRVEYRLTEFGRKFRRTLDALDALEVDFEAARADTRRTVTPVVAGEPARAPDRGDTVTDR